MTIKWTPQPDLPPPVPEKGIWRWIVKNLFPSSFNTLLTLFGLAIISLIIPPFVRWAFIDAAWIGDSRLACDQLDQTGSLGACWVFIKVRFNLFLYGFYPDAERWRVNFCFVLLMLSLIPILAGDLIQNKKIDLSICLAGVITVFALFGVGPGIFAAFFFLTPYLASRLSFRQAFVSGPDEMVISLFFRAAIAALVFTALYYCAQTLGGPQAALPLAVLSVIIILPLLFFRPMPVSAWRWIYLFTVYPVSAYLVLIGEAFGLPLVETHYWGGLFLTLVVAGTGMALALPIGILLALGRRSEMPVTKTLCVVFIELVRGVPLVSVLFMASVMFPLFLPEDVNFDKLLRALIGVALFYAAYMAEVIRGGLQAIPKGQYEAARAMGWSYWKMMALIILPQVLRLVIPGLANNYLSLIKDTTLVAVIGLMDVLGIVKAAMADAEWIGFTAEAYVFAAALFWIFCFAISRYSMYLEKKYHISYH